MLLNSMHDGYTCEMHRKLRQMKARCTTTLMIMIARTTTRHYLEEQHTEQILCSQAEQHAAGSESPVASCCRTTASTRLHEGARWARSHERLGTPMRTNGKSPTPSMHRVAAMDRTRRIHCRACSVLLAPTGDVYFRYRFVQSDATHYISTPACIELVQSERQADRQTESTRFGH
jgi:hypothetical protein